MADGRRKAWMASWEACQRRRSLRRSAPRQTVVEAFLDATDHVTVEELHGLVCQRTRGVGYATVYRTMRLLQECGLADERRFDQGAARFEPSGPLKQEHSHFVCSSCGAVVEFPCDRLPGQLAEAAGAHGFQVERCTVAAVGLCARCRKDGAGR